MDEASIICARLIRDAAVERDQIQGIENLDIRKEVERRLGSVGLELATSAYSSHVGLRLSRDSLPESHFDSASNLRLRSDACALLVVLWSRLVLPKRTIIDRNQPPGQASIIPSESRDRSRQYQPEIRFETLVREFGPVIGSRAHLERLVSQLRRLGFIETLAGKRIVAGPLLELGVDGERMIAFVKRSVIKDLLSQENLEDDSGLDPIEQLVIENIRSLGGSASLRQVASVSGERLERLRRIVMRLEKDGVLRRVGTGAATRYSLAGV